MPMEEDRKTHTCNRDIPVEATLAVEGQAMKLRKAIAGEQFEEVLPVVLLQLQRELLSTIPHHQLEAAMPARMPLLRLMTILGNTPLLAERRQLQNKHTHKRKRATTTKLILRMCLWV
jgi:hypothetical protein